MKQKEEKRQADVLHIQVNHAKAYGLLRNLEELQLIRILKYKPDQEPMSKRYGGKLSAQTAEALNNYISESRAQWNR